MVRRVVYVKGTLRYRCVAPSASPTVRPAYEHIFHTHTHIVVRISLSRALWFNANGRQRDVIIMGNGPQRAVSGGYVYGSARVGHQQNLGCSLRTSLTIAVTIWKCLHVLWYIYIYIWLICHINSRARWDQNKAITIIYALRSSSSVPTEIV